MDIPKYIKPDREKWLKYLEEEDNKDKGGLQKYLKLKEMLYNEL